MKYELPKPGLQTKPCPHCDGMMELRLGMWDCRRCGQQEAPAADPLEAIKPDPTLSIKRAKLLQRTDEETRTLAGDPDGTLFGEPGPGAINSLPMKFACLGLQLLIVVTSHAYLLGIGITNSWIESDYILSRVAVQAIYAGLIAVGLFWNELPPKYFSGGLSIIVMVALMARSFIALGVAPHFEFLDSPWIPQVSSYYWYIFTLLHLGLCTWLFFILSEDIGQYRMRR